jgi:hypothetical protein
LRAIRFLFLGLVLNYASWSQELSDRAKHDIATDAIADVLFDGQSKPVRDRQSAFEKVNGVKLHFTVEDASLDKLGGLSEHLFKLFKTISSPVNVQAKTITGEFSLLQNQVLSNILSYRTTATSDLRSCALPEKETGPLDSMYTSNLNGGAVLAEEYNDAPQYIDETLLLATANYDGVLRKNASCLDVFSSSEYDLHVKNTRQSRKSTWADDAENISHTLESQMIVLPQNYSSAANNNSGSLGIGPLASLSQLTGSHVINCNNSLDPCTQRDMEMRCRILFKQTGLRYLFVTKDLDYFLPKDSISKFRDAATISFSAASTNSVIAALYLRMYDASAGVYGTALLVRQVNGEWLTNADIAFATYNNGGNYKASTYYRFTNLYKNIPKPVIICYQVAKVSGLLTTTYLRKGNAVKGRDQIFYHVFKMDEAFEEVGQYAQQISSLYQMTGGTGGALIGTTGYANNSLVYSQIADLRTRQKIAYINADRNPKFNESDVHFKEVYLQDNAIAQAAALKQVQIKYGQLYSNNKFDELVANVGIPSDINEGSCASGGSSDAIADFLSISSLVLSPTGLDIIADALAVAYFASTDQTLDMFMASASFFMPGSLSGARSVVNSTADALVKMKKGGHLIVEAGQIKAIDPELNRITTLFKLDPEDINSTLVAKVKDNPEISGLLTGVKRDCDPCLPVTTAQAKVWQNAERLPEEKRFEFLNKTFDDGAFRGKVYDDPDEILRWGGNYLENVPDDKSIESLSATIPMLPGPSLPQKIAFTFQNSNYVNRKLTSNETFYKYHGTDNRTGRKYSWLTKTKYVDEETLREKLAIRDDWGVVIETVSEFDVPAGTWVSEGVAAAQGAGYSGGDYQAVILNIPRAWIIRSDKAWN